MKICRLDVWKKQAQYNKRREEVGLNLNNEQMKRVENQRRKIAERFSIKNNRTSKIKYNIPQNC